MLMNGPLLHSNLAEQFVSSSVIRGWQRDHIPLHIPIAVKEDDELSSVRHLITKLVLLFNLPKKYLEVDRIFTNFSTILVQFSQQDGTQYFFLVPLVTER